MSTTFSFCDFLFKDTLVQYKAYLLNSANKEEDIDRQFIDFAIKNERKKKLLQDNCNTDKKKPPMTKYRFTTDFEPSFPAFRKAFTKLKNTIKDDDEL